MDWCSGLTIKKSTTAVLDYKFDWSAWLGAGEGIATRSVTASAGLTIDSDSADSTGVEVWLSGGAAGCSYELTCEITTNSIPARTDQRSVTVQVVG